MAFEKSGEDSDDLASVGRLKKTFADGKEQLKEIPKQFVILEDKWSIGHFKMKTICDKVNKANPAVECFINSGLSAQSTDSKVCVFSTQKKHLKEAKELFETNMTEVKKDITKNTPVKGTDFDAYPK